MPHIPNATWLTTGGVRLKLWAPHPAEPDRLAWWWPLQQVVQHAWRKRFPWPIWLHEFQLVGCVDRGPRPRVWIYAHLRADGELFVDEDGTTYRLIRRADGGGSFRADELRASLWRTGVTRVTDPNPPPWEELESRGAQPWPAVPFPGRVEVRPLDDEGGTDGPGPDDLARQLGPLPEPGRAGLLPANRPVQADARGGGRTKRGRPPGGRRHLRSVPGVGEGTTPPVRRRTDRREAGWSEP